MTAAVSIAELDKDIALLRAEATRLRQQPASAAWAHSKAIQFERVAEHLRLIRQAQQMTVATTGKRLVDSD